MEQKLWKNGICTWNDFLLAKEIRGIGKDKKPFLDRELHKSKRAVLDGSSEYFHCLPSVEQWRLWDEFGEEACFIDIETNYRNDITVLGISDGERVWQFVRHHNMNARQIHEVLSRFKLMVTFNGASFDLPIIRGFFRDVLPDVPHLDLRHAAARAGYTGGLKKIEKDLGIQRAAEVDGVSGADALRLWHAYRATGKTQYRDTLLTYNAEDIVNLRPVAKKICSILSDNLRKSLNS